MHIAKNVALGALVLLACFLLAYIQDDSYGLYDAPGHTSPVHYWGFFPKVVSDVLYMVIKPHGKFIQYYHRELIFSGMFLLLGVLLAIFLKRKR